MLKKTLLVLACVALLLGPAVGLTAVGVLANPAAQSYGAGCLPASDGPVTGPLAEDAPVPEKARAWIRKAAQTCSNLPEVWIAAVMYQESGFRPDVYAPDVNGGTWGLFQINRSIWRDTYDGDWSADLNRNGTWDIKEPMIHAEYGAKYLCDLLEHVRDTRAEHPDWASTKDLTELEALVVAHNGGPGRLATYPDLAPVTHQYLDDVRRYMREWTDPSSGPGGSDPPSPGSNRVVMPLPDGTYRISSRYGLRRNPTGPGWDMHDGLDFAADDGTPIMAVADGKVVQAGLVPGNAGTIEIQHTINRQRVATRYLHMWADGIHVKAGDTVTAGQHIGDVGSSGNSSGPHLHLEVRPGWPTSPTVNPERWLKKHHAIQLDEPDTRGGGEECDPANLSMPGPPRPFTGEPGGRLPDPTGTGGWITRQTAHLLAETKRAFPNTSWSCWYATANPSEHPLGRACDVTFGNQIGERPTDHQKAAGWTVAKWLQKYADPLWVEYLIWQGRIWSVARNSEGWRKYDGGGLADPDDITGGHYDHVHISVR